MTLTTALVESLFTVAASAPSAHNTQPWVPEITSCTPTVAEVRVGADPARVLPHGDPRSEDLHLSLGCWVEALTIAAAEVGLRTESVTVRGRGPTVDIRVRLATGESIADPAEKDPASADGSVWPAFRTADLHHRQVDRGPLVRAEARFAEAAAICRSAMADTAVDLVEVPDRAWRAWLRRAALHSFGDRPVFAETLRWLRFDPADPRYHRDGLTAECLRIPAAGARAAVFLDRPWLRSWIVGLTSVGLRPFALADSAMRSFANSDRGSRRSTLRRSLRAGLRRTSAAKPTSSARHDRRHSHHLVLSVPDRPTLSAADEVRVGRILLRLWLTLDRHGLRVDVHSEVKDSPTVRRELATFLRGRPIAAFSAGASTTPVPRAPRLPTV